MGRHNDANWQEKCLLIIEFLCEHKCIGPRAHVMGMDCVACDIYKIAHVGTAGCDHEEWDKKVEKLWETMNRIKSGSDELD